MSEREVQDIEGDIEGEMNQLLEDIPIGLIFNNEETETDLVGAETEPSTEERGGATQAVASQRCMNASGEGRKEQGHDSGHPGAAHANNPLVPLFAIKGSVMILRSCLQCVSPLSVKHFRVWSFTFALKSTAFSFHGMLSRSVH